MATTGTKMKTDPTLDLMVKIVGGKDVPTVGKVPNNGSVVFTNGDPEVRYVQLFNNSNSYHPPLFIALQPGESVTVTGGWSSDDHDTVCPYNVRIPGDNPPPPRIATGGNKIIIGSGSAKEGKTKKHKK